MTVCHYGRWTFIFWCITNFLVISVMESDGLLEDKLIQLLHKLEQEQPIDTILLYRNGQSYCIFEPMLKRVTDKPFLIVTNGSTGYDWNYSRHTVLLCCNSQAETEQNEHTMFSLQLARRLVYSDIMTPLQICTTYFEREQHNVAVLDGNFQNTSIFKICRIVNHLTGVANYVQQQLESETPVFVHQFRDMQGAPIVTEADRLPPRSMVFQDPKTGETKMVGNVAMLVNTFIERLNATLKFRTEYGDEHKMVVGAAEKWVRLGQLDIATSMTSSSVNLNLDYLSYPYLISNFCFMLPVPASLDHKEIYLLIIHPQVLTILLVLHCIYSLLLIYSEALSWRRLNLMNILLNDKSLRGLLGQSFPLSTNPRKNMKFLLCLLYFASIMFTTMYQAYLGALLTQPPTEPLLRSLMDISKSRYRILMAQGESILLPNIVNDSTKLAVSDTFKILEDYKEYIQIRDSFNGSYIYPVTGLRWSTFAEQQKLFQKNLFYYSTDICLEHLLLLCLPIRKNLPYRDLFELHILATQEFGLANHWITQGFYNMVHLGLIPFKDLSSTVGHEVINIDDLYWIWCFYFAALTSCCLCFVLELLLFRWQRRFHRQDYSF